MQLADDMADYLTIRVVDEVDHSILQHLDLNKKNTKKKYIVIKKIVF